MTQVTRVARAKTVRS